MCYPVGIPWGVGVNVRRTLTRLKRLPAFVYTRALNAFCEEKLVRRTIFFFSNLTRLTPSFSQETYFEAIYPLIHLDK